MINAHVCSIVAAGTFCSRDNPDCVSYAPSLLQVKVWQPQNPVTRLKVWLKFKEIQATWDPSMDQTEFVAGARCCYLHQRKPNFHLEFLRQAVLTIASILSTGGQWGRLRGLLHRKEHKRLQQVPNIHPFRSQFCTKVSSKMLIVKTLLSISSNHQACY